MMQPLEFYQMIWCHQVTIIECFFLACRYGEVATHRMGKDCLDLPKIPFTSYIFFIAFIFSQILFDVSCQLTHSPCLTLPSKVTPGPFVFPSGLVVASKDQEFVILNLNKYSRYCLVFVRQCNKSLWVFFQDYLKACVKNGLSNLAARDIHGMYGESRENSI